MQLVYERCAGLDRHQKTGVACAILPDERGQRQNVLQTFSAMTLDLLPLERLASEPGRDPGGDGINRGVHAPHNVAKSGGHRLMRAEGWWG